MNAAWMLLGFFERLGQLKPAWATDQPVKGILLLSGLARLSACGVKLGLATLGLGSGWLSYNTPSKVQLHMEPSAQSTQGHIWEAAHACHVAIVSMQTARESLKGGSRWVYLQKHTCFILGQ